MEKVIKKLFGTSTEVLRTEESQYGFTAWCNLWGITPVVILLKDDHYEIYSEDLTKKLVSEKYKEDAKGIF